MTQQFHSHMYMWKNWKQEVLVHDWDTGGPQLTSTPAHTKLTAITQSHWKKSSKWVEPVLQIGQARKYSHWKGSWHTLKPQRTITRVRDTTKSLGGWDNRFLSYILSHGQDWKTLLFDLMPRSQYRQWRKMKSPHWVLNIWKSLPHTCR